MNNFSKEIIPKKRYSSLVIVSNKLPVSFAAGGQKQIIKNDGGLIAGLGSVFAQCQDSLWFGYAGDISESDRNLLDKSFNPVFIENKVYQNYYGHFSNETLWPIMHAFPSKMRYREEWWIDYQEANRLYANAVAKDITSDSYIWIQDYHLMLVPRYLRELGVKNPIGYFQHTPFPDTETIGLIPPRQYLMESLLYADYIGFYVDKYVKNFISSVQGFTEARETGNILHCDGHDTKVGSHIFGPDAKKILATAIETPNVDLSQFNLRSRPNDKVLLGIERLDYSKGLLHKLEAFATLLEKNEYQDNSIRLFQLCIPTRMGISAFELEKKLVEEKIKAINNQFGYQAVIYHYGSVSMEVLRALYREADVMLVTPLRDGFNLVCEEYIVANQGNKSNLILSEFAGAAQCLKKWIHPINPYNISELAAAMHRALDTGSANQDAQAMYDFILENDNQAWANSYMHAWDEFINHTPK